MVRCRMGGSLAVVGPLVASAEMGRPALTARLMMALTSVAGEIYHCGLMSARPTFDSMRFARAGETLSGVVAIADLARLRDLLSDDAGSVAYRISGQSRSGRPALRLEIETTVRLICQYCLEAFERVIQVDTSLPLARDEAELERWERDDPLLDALVADSAADVLTLVEDEILLSLPVAPRHADGICGRAGHND